MSTFVLIHGSGDVGWYWHLVEAQLRKHGHDVVAPDLPCDDDSAGLNEYADTVVKAIGDRKNLIVVGQSFGGFTAPLVAARVPTDALVLVAAMIPKAGETADEYWGNTGYREAMQQQAARDGGLTGHEFAAWCASASTSLPMKSRRDIAWRSVAQKHSRTCC